MIPFGKPWWQMLPVRYIPVAHRKPVVVPIKIMVAVDAIVFVILLFFVSIRVTMSMVMIFFLGKRHHRHRENDCCYRYQPSFPAHFSSPNE